MTAAKLARHPLAFGITWWGPLPGSRCCVMWDGPGSGLYLYAGNPEAASTPPAIRIRHESASGTYATLRQAERAVTAFVTAGTT